MFRKSVQIFCGNTANFQDVQDVRFGGYTRDFYILHWKAFLPANFILPCCGNYYSCCMLKEKYSTTENHGRFPLGLSKGLGNSTWENNGQRFFRHKNSPRAKLGFLDINSPHGGLHEGLYPGKTGIMDLKIT